MKKIEKAILLFLMIIPVIQSVSAISNVQHSVDGNKVTLNYQGTPPFWINLRGDSNIGQAGGYLWAKTNSNSFSYDMSFAVNPSKKFYYGVKDSSWSNVNNFLIGELTTPNPNKTVPCQHFGYKYGTAKCISNKGCSVITDFDICDCIKSNGGECCSDEDCNLNIGVKGGACLNKQGILNGNSGAKCYLKPQLTGNKKLKLLIIEFAPKDVSYGSICLCNYFGTKSITNTKVYCKDPVQCFNYLEVINNPSGQVKFDYMPPANQLSSPNYVRDGEVRIPHSFYHINQYLKEEALKYGVTNIPEFEIEIKGPLMLDDLTPKTTGLFDYYNVDQYFDEKINENNIDISYFDYIAIIYLNDEGVILGLNPSDPYGVPIIVEEDRHPFVNHAGDKSVYLSLKTQNMNELAAHILLHEMLHQFGASDTYVQGEGPNAPEWCTHFSCCTDPDGIPEPNKVPKYPQTKGCIMCAEAPIVIELGKQIPTSDLGQQVICEKTAKEIGWTG